MVPRVLRPYKLRVLMVAGITGKGVLQGERAAGQALARATKAATQKTAWKKIAPLSRRYAAARSFH